MYAVHEGTSVGKAAWAWRGVGRACVQNVWLNGLESKGSW